MSQTLRAILFACAVLCFVVAAVWPQHGRLLPVGLAFGFGVFLADAIDAA